MPESIGSPDLKRLIAEGVDAQTTAQFDHRKPIAVYCHDAL
jgi:hypothetical protein